MKIIKSIEEEKIEQDIEEKINNINDEEVKESLINIKQFMINNFKFLLMFTLTIVWQLLVYLKIELSSYFLELVVIVAISSTLNKKLISSMLFNILLSLILIIIIITLNFHIYNEFLILLFLILFMSKIQSFRN